MRHKRDSQLSDVHEDHQAKPSNILTKLAGRYKSRRVYSEYMNGSLGNPDASLEHSPADSYCAIDIEADAPTERSERQTADTYDLYVPIQSTSSSETAESGAAAGAASAVGSGPPLESSTASQDEHDKFAVPIASSYALVDVGSSSRVRGERADSLRATGGSGYQAAEPVAAGQAYDDTKKSDATPVRPVILSSSAADDGGVRASDPIRRATDEDEENEDATLTAGGDDDDTDEVLRPQEAFEEFKRMIALSRQDAEDRKEALEALGERFSASAHAALAGLPPLDLRTEKGHIGFSSRDMESIELKTELEFLRNAGGRAGGVKAAHRRLGLFLKFAFDNEGIYGSLTMAAKAAKREAAASRWVHAMDKVAISTPLLQVVDLPVRTTRGGARVLRVKVFAMASVAGGGPGETTLRVGSADGALSIHTDFEQEHDVVRPLAEHFFLGPSKQPSCQRVHKHQYVAQRTEADSVFPPANAAIAEKELRNFFPDGWEDTKDEVMEAFGFSSQEEDAIDAATSGPGTPLTAEDHEEVLGHHGISDSPPKDCLTKVSAYSAVGQTHGSATSVDLPSSGVEPESSGAASGGASSAPHGSVSLSVLDFLRDSGVNVESMLQETRVWTTALAAVSGELDAADTGQSAGSTPHEDAAVAGGSAVMGAAFSRDSVSGQRRGSLLLSERESSASLDPGSHDSLQQLQSQQAQLLHELIDAAKESGADLSDRIVFQSIEDRIETTEVGQVSDTRVETALPFDVEVHQMNNGQRMVLDTHRLLIPDADWISWMQGKSFSAQPRVWAMLLESPEASAASSHRDPPGGTVLRGALTQLNRKAVKRAMREPAAVRHIAAAAVRWLQESKGRLGWRVTQASVCPDYGAILIGMQSSKDVSCAAAAGAHGLSGKGEAAAPDTACRAVVVVSCPRWYWGNNPFLTCTLPPEGAGELRRMQDFKQEGRPIGSSADEGKVTPDPSDCSAAAASMTEVMPVSPDDTMRGNKDNAVKAVRALTSPERLERVWREVVRRNESEISPESLDVPPSTGRDARPQGQQRETFRKVRTIVKEVLHAHGLGLRYVRLLLEHHSSGEAADVSGHTRIAHLVSQCLLFHASATLSLAHVMELAGQLRNIGRQVEGMHVQDADRLYPALLVMASESRLFASKGVAAAMEPSTLRALHEEALSPVYVGTRHIENSSGCVGTKLAAAFHQSRFDKIKALFRELAHLQRVGVDEQNILDEISQLTKQNAVTTPLRTQCYLRLASIELRGQFETVAKFTSMLPGALTVVPLDRSHGARLRIAVLLPGEDPSGEQDWRDFILNQVRYEYAASLDRLGRNLSDLELPKLAVAVMHAVLRMTRVATVPESRSYAAVLWRMAKYIEQMNEYKLAAVLYGRCLRIAEKLDAEMAAKMSGRARRWVELPSVDENTRTYHIDELLWTAAIREDVVQEHTPGSDAAGSDAGERGEQAGPPAMAVEEAIQRAAELEASPLETDSVLTGSDSESSDESSEGDGSEQIGDSDTSSCTGSEGSGSGSSCNDGSDSGSLDGNESLYSEDTVSDWVRSHVEIELGLLRCQLESGTVSPEDAIATIVRNQSVLMDAGLDDSRAFGRSLLLQADLAARSGSGEDAVDIATRALAAFKDGDRAAVHSDTGKPHLVLAQCLGRCKRYAEAEHHATEAVKVFLVTRGISHSSTREALEALTGFQRQAVAGGPL